MKCFDIYCGRDNILSVTPKKLLKTQIPEKEANFQMKKKCLTNISRNIEYWKPHGVSCGGTQRLLTIFVQVIRPLLQDLRGCWKYNILERKR